MKLEFMAKKLWRGHPSFTSELLICVKIQQLEILDSATRSERDFDFSNSFLYCIQLQFIRLIVGPGIHEKPGPETDQSGSTRDSQCFRSYFDPWFRSVDPCIWRNNFEPLSIFNLIGGKWNPYYCPSRQFSQISAFKGLSSERFCSRKFSSEAGLFFENDKRRKNPTFEKEQTQRF